MLGVALARRTGRPFLEASALAHSAWAASYRSFALAVERSTASGVYHAADTTKGGFDTTFTPVTGATSVVSLPTNAPLPMRVTFLLTPS